MDAGPSGEKEFGLEKNLSQTENQKGHKPPAGFHSSKTVCAGKSATGR